jgi:hypothetical protein
MTKDKRIDEMAKDLCRTDTCEIKKIGIPCNHRCKAHIYATRAIEKDYRKASDVAREIFEEIEEHIKADRTPSFSRGYYGIINFIAELKKKYTEDYDGQTD